MRSRADLQRMFAVGGLLLDGAMGTELERRGVPTPAPLWSAAALLGEGAAVVEAIHRDYVAAGADILVTNTFRTNPRTLKRAGRPDEGPTINARAVDLARRAAGAAPRDVLVAASVAPVEDCYTPEQAPDVATLAAEHATLTDWLADAGPDMIWIETMGTLCEAVAAAAAAAGRACPFVVSFVLREDGALLGGDRLEDAVREITPLEPLAFGLNCIPPRGLMALLPALRRCTSLPLVAYAHVGNVRPIRGWSYAEPDVSPAEYAAYAARWCDMGAAVVGGCCGTTPAHIRAIRES